MVKNTGSENSNSDDASAADGPAEKPKRGLRRRVTAAKSATTHVNAGAEIVLDTVPDAAAPAPAKRGGRKKKGDGRARGRSIHGSGGRRPARRTRCRSRTRLDRPTAVPGARSADPVARGDGPPGAEPAWRRSAGVR